VSGRTLVCILSVRGVREGEWIQV